MYSNPRNLRGLAVKPSLIQMTDIQTGGNTMKLEFRTLTKDEIECRVSTVKQNGLSLLLYKDARADQNILDETVGSLNWQRHHSRDNKNCVVSDSFKRACFNWGIGRELYTAPFIWIPADKCNIQQRSNGTFTCYDRFKVEQIIYEGKKIVALSIRNTTKRMRVFAEDYRQKPQPAKAC